jgi:putative restriction endonuclease
MSLLADRASRNGGFISRAELSSFDVDGVDLRLIDQSRGIWNPTWMDATLSIVSARDSPYRDEEIDGGFFHYAYRAGSTEGDNRKLRRAQQLELPIILLRKIDAGVFLPVFPVYVVADDIQNRRFLLALDASLRFLRDPLHLTEDERRYAETVVRSRLHQPEFRGRVIRAYATTCAVCRLRHAELLDAAHIIPDSQESGRPVVQNGLSLCKIHHGAYDSNLLGITPDYTVVIDRDLLIESDGPMLQYGLQAMHGETLSLPAREADWPDRARLALRYEGFSSAS